MLWPQAESKPATVLKEATEFTLAETRRACFLKLHYIPTTTAPVTNWLVTHGAFMRFEAVNTDSFRAVKSKRSDRRRERLASFRFFSRTEQGQDFDCLV
jgi:hypothetical protein